MAGRKAYVTIAEAMEMLHLSRATIYRIFRGHIVRVGRRAYIPKALVVKEQKRRRPAIIV